MYTPPTLFDNLLARAQSVPLTDKLIHMNLPVWLSSDLSQNTWVVGILTAGMLLCYLVLVINGNSKDAKYPWGEQYTRYAPRWLSGLIWATSSKSVMKRSFDKFRKTAFRVARHDINLIMLPAGAVDEVCALRDEVGSNLQALEYDLVSKYTGLGILRDSHLHARFVHRRITPNISFLAKGIEEEVSTVLDQLFNDEDGDWHELSPYPLLTKISSQASSRIMLGRKYARNEGWQTTATKFTENFLGSVVLLRYFPTWTYPVLQYALPSIWSAKSYLHQAKRILGPDFEEILSKQAQGNWKSSQEEDSWGIELVTELATNDEKSINNLVHAQILLVLASIPTTVFSEANVIFDMLARPEYIELVREEIQEVGENGWSVDCYSRLHKLDSILRESQRLAPPTLIGLRRIMKRDHTLQDGTFLPEGSYICVPSYTIQNHPDTTPDASAYDGMRSYRKRVNSDGNIETSKHQFTTTETEVLGFGHGRTACPGRWLAAIALKIIISKLVIEFDMKFPRGQTERPKNSVVHEFLSADPKATILMRRRKAKLRLTQVNSQGQHEMQPAVHTTQVGG